MSRARVVRPYSVEREEHQAATLSESHGSENQWPQTSQLPACCWGKWFSLLTDFILNFFHLVSCCFEKDAVWSSFWNLYVLLKSRGRRGDDKSMKTALRFNFYLLTSRPQDLVFRKGHIPYVLQYYWMVIQHMLHCFFFPLNIFLVCSYRSRE